MHTHTQEKWVKCVIHLFFADLQKKQSRVHVRRRMREKENGRLGEATEQAEERERR